LHLSAQDCSAYAGEIAIVAAKIAIPDTAIPSSLFSEIVAEPWERLRRDTKNPITRSPDSFISPARALKPHQLAFTLALFG
jgi:hypothetical protein